jgi:hypothetical protein
MFSDDPALQAIYESRVYELETAITWENTVFGAADLYIGVGNSEGPFFVGEDETNVEPGPHTERFGLSSSDLDGRHQELATSGYHIQTMTDWVSAGFSGVPVEVTIEAALKGSNIVIR